MSNLVNTEDPRPEQVFEEVEVAEHYRFRPAYPEPLMARLVEISPGRSALLDLGCGTGEITRRISRLFESTLAIDASQAMLEQAQTIAGDHLAGVSWQHARAEDASLAGRQFDLMVAGASIHWMDHDVVFPRLLNHAHREHVFAVVSGDDASDPPWQSQWQVFLDKWIGNVSDVPYEPDNQNSEFQQYMQRHTRWIDDLREETYTSLVRQSVDDFVKCQFSRATFAPSKLAQDLPEFSHELKELLHPHARSGMLSYNMNATLQWGRIRSTEK